MTFNVKEAMQHPKDSSNCFRVEFLDELMDSTKNHMFVKLVRSRKIKQINK